MSVKFVSAILGPEMAAPILWTPGKKRSFCRKTHVHKFLVLGGGILGCGGGGGSADFIFMGARIFLNVGQRLRGRGGGGKTYRVNLGGGGETYCRVCSRKPLLEASEIGLALVGASFFEGK